MSHSHSATGSQAANPSSTATSAGGRARVRRWLPLLVTTIVLGWSIMELVGLALKHTTGPEMYGVLVAVVAVAAGVLSLVLLGSIRRRPLSTAAVLALWAIVALGGIAGTVAHVVGPVAGHGPVDLRPRPVAAPLVFTALGLFGGAALFYGQRAGSPRVRRR